MGGGGDCGGLGEVLLRINVFVENLLSVTRVGGWQLVVKCACLLTAPPYYSTK